MPQRKTSVQDLKKSRARRLHNLVIKTDLRKTIKSFVEALEKDQKEAAKLLPTLYKKLDKASKRNILPKNTASRRKARYAKLLTAKKA